MTNCFHVSVDQYTSYSSSLTALNGISEKKGTSFQDKNTYTSKPRWSVILMEQHANTSTLSEYVHHSHCLFFQNDRDEGCKLELTGTDCVCAEQGGFVCGMWARKCMHARGDGSEGGGGVHALFYRSTTSFLTHDTCTLTLCVSWKATLHGRKTITHDPAVYCIISIHAYGCCLSGY